MVRMSKSERANYLLMLEEAVSAGDVKEANQLREILGFPVTKRELQGRIEYGASVYKIAHASGRLEIVESVADVVKITKLRRSDIVVMMISGERINGWKVEKVGG